MASLHVASELVKAITNIIYPVGSIYISTNTANPSSYLGGTWKQVAKDCYLIGYNASNTWFDKIGTSKGSNGKSGNWNTDSHTLTINEIPSHNHIKYAFGSWGASSYNRTRIGAGVYIGKDQGNPQYEDQPSSTTSSTGGGQGHNHFHVSPYYVVSVWRRTA